MWQASFPARSNSSVVDECCSCFVFALALCFSDETVTFNIVFSFLVVQLDLETDHATKNSVGRLQRSYNMLLDWNMWMFATVCIGRECLRTEWLNGMRCAA